MGRRVTEHNLLAVLLSVPGVVLVLAAPIAMVLLSFSAVRFPSWPWPGWSVQWYLSLFNNQELGLALVRSTWVGALTSFLSAVVGFPVGYALARLTTTRALGLLSLFTVPVFTPFLLFGFSFIFVARAFGLDRSLLGVTLGHVVLFSPIVVALCFHRCKQLDPKLESAASELGASDMRVLLEIVGLQVWPTILASMCLVFVMSWDEYIVSWFLSGFTKTFPVMVRNLLESTMSPEISAAGVLVGLTSCLLVLTAGRLLARSE